jgi:hypothetical protein
MYLVICIDLQHVFDDKVGYQYYDKDDKYYIPYSGLKWFPFKKQKHANEFINDMKLSKYHYDYYFYIINFNEFESQVLYWGE